MAQQSDLTWFILVDTYGQPFKGTTVSSVSVSPTAVIDEFRDAVHLKNSSLLSGIVSSQLFVYRNKTDYDGKKDPLKSSLLLNGYGKSEEDALVVAVPRPIRFLSSINANFDYKHSKAVYSSQSFLISIARELEKIYPIPCRVVQRRLIVTFVDVISAYENNPEPKPEYRDKYPRLQDFYTEHEWSILEGLDKLVNPRQLELAVGDGYSKKVILPIEVCHYGPYFQRIALKSHVVSELSHCIVKNEGSSSKE